MSYSSDVVADAVRGYWKTCYPRTVMAFFYQKYEYDTEWEWCEELVDCNSSNDFETVIFQNDFCEGQTCVKDISIVSLDDIVECYTKNHISSMSDSISRHSVMVGIQSLIEDLPNKCKGNYNIERLRYLECLEVVNHAPSAQPETCEGCKHLGKWENEVEYGYPSPCTRCRRRVEDYYER